jgi:hypothetical protein
MPEKCYPCTGTNLLPMCLDYTFPRPNKRLQRTGISVPLIDNLPLAQLSPGR